MGKLRWWLLKVIGLVGLLWVVAVPAVLAEPDGGSAGELLAALNGARQGDGLAALEPHGDLVAVAAAHATRMADQGRIFHNGELADEVVEWEELGENVGVGPTVEALHDALMGSPGHRRNILSTRFNHIGIAVERRGERIYAVQVFRRLAPAAGPVKSAPAAAVPVARAASAKHSPAPAPSASPTQAPAPAPVSTPAVAAASESPAMAPAPASPTVNPEPVSVSPVAHAPRATSLPAPISVGRRVSTELVFANGALLALVATWCGRAVFARRMPGARRLPSFAAITAAA